MINLETRHGVVRSRFAHRCPFFVDRIGQAVGKRAGHRDHCPLRRLHRFVLLKHGAQTQRHRRIAVALAASASMSAMSPRPRPLSCARSSHGRPAPRETSRAANRRGITMSRTFTDITPMPHAAASRSTSSLISWSSWSRRSATSAAVERPTASRMAVCARNDTAA